MRTLRKLTWVELKLFVRDPLTMIFSLAFPVLTLIILAAAFGNTPATGREDVFRGVGAMDYYVPGYVGLAMASLGLIGIPVHLASYRERGVLRRFRASAIPASSFLGAQMVVSLAIDLCGALLIFTLGVLFYDVRLPVSPGGLAVAFLTSVVSFSAIGFLLGSLLPSARAAQGLGLILFFVMMFLAGTDGPREILGEALRRIGDFLPLTHVVTALQDPWIGFGTNVTELLIVAGVAVGAALAAGRVFRWD